MPHPAKLMEYSPSACLTPEAFGHAACTDAPASTGGADQSQQLCCLLPVAHTAAPAAIGDQTQRLCSPTANPTPNTASYDQWRLPKASHGGWDMARMPGLPAVLACFRPLNTRLCQLQLAAPANPATMLACRLCMPPVSLCTYDCCSRNRCRLPNPEKLIGCGPRACLTPMLCWPGTLHTSKSCASYNFY